MDGLWAFGDARGRGFVCGATAGRTTLNGEGLQHEDGHSHLLASAVPCCVAYDPAFAYELAAIVRDGLRRMYENNEDVYFYLSVYNQDYAQPPKPEGSDGGILRGLYRFRAAPQQARHRAQLIGSGVILLQSMRAQEMLAEKWDVAADVWSMTSAQQIRNEALSVERWNRLHPDQAPRVPFVTQALAGAEGPVVVSSDWMKSVNDMPARWIPNRFVALGTDGFGRSDTREALRRHFEIDAEHIVVATLNALMLDGKVDSATVAQAIRDYGIDPERVDPREA
jgi:pyruvate dehydrogenase E1 component